MPAVGEQDQSRKLMKDVFARELQDVSPSARRSLAQKLLGEAAKMPDAQSDQFVVVGGAIQASLEAADLPLAFQAADRMADVFDLDGLTLKAGIALKMSPKNYAAHSAENLEAGVGLLDSLESTENFMAASRLVALF